jgi:hypothetical protein
MITSSGGANSLLTDRGFVVFTFKTTPVTALQPFAKEHTMNFAKTVLAGVPARCPRHRAGEGRPG